MSPARPPWWSSCTARIGRPGVEVTLCELRAAGSAAGRSWLYVDRGEGGGPLACRGLLRARAGRRVRPVVEVGAAERTRSRGAARCELGRVAGVCLAVGLERRTGGSLGSSGGGELGCRVAGTFRRLNVGTAGRGGDRCGAELGRAGSSGGELELGGWGVGACAWSPSWSRRLGWAAPAHCELGGRAAAPSPAGTCCELGRVVGVRLVGGEGGGGSSPAGTCCELGRVAGRRRAGRAGLRNVQTSERRDGWGRRRRSPCAAELGARAARVLLDVTTTSTIDARPRPAGDRRHVPRVST
jgi:hypothetical protein